jgi:hypothetical protein
MSRRLATRRRARRAAKPHGPGPLRVEGLQRGVTRAGDHVGSGHHDLGMHEPADHACRNQAVRPFFAAYACTDMRGDVQGLGTGVAVRSTMGVSCRSASLTVSPKARGCSGGTASTKRCSLKRRKTCPAGARVCGARGRSRLCTSLMPALGGREGSAGDRSLQPGRSRR